jgi:S-adenosylmethionine-diacylgycerolhomoserine-N-methlytransferase
MGWVSDLKVLYHLVLRPVRGHDHASRLESFYAGQAEDYDRFRRRLLQGRQELWSRLEVPEGGVWVDLGGGTGSNLELLGERLARLRQMLVVDLSPSLLDVARRRIAARGWPNVQAVEADATTFRPPEPADVVTFSYSLTMIPDWFAAIENALAMLRPGGLLGVVDFYVARKYPDEGGVRHGWWTRTFWPAWFALDNVFLSPDHLPFLRRRLDVLHVEERRAKVPYLPLARVPYYLFIGRKAARPDANAPGAAGHRPASWRC